MILTRWDNRRCNTRARLVIQHSKRKEHLMIVSDLIGDKEGNKKKVIYSSILMICYRTKEISKERTFVIKRKGDIRIDECKR
jgi:hypothetical protein